MLPSNCNPALCHATIISMIRQYIEKFDHPRDFLRPILRDMGNFLSHAKVIYLAHAGHIRAYLHGMQPGYKVGHQSQQYSLCQSSAAILVLHACVNPKSLGCLDVGLT